jgi:hypothetical protein
MDIINELTSTVGSYSSNGAVLTVKVLVDSFSNLFSLLSPKGNCDEELRHTALDDQNVTRLIGRFR